MCMHVCAVCPMDSWSSKILAHKLPSVPETFHCLEFLLYKGRLMAHFKALTASFSLESMLLFRRFELSFSSGPTGIWKTAEIAHSFWDRKLCPPPWYALCPQTCPQDSRSMMQPSVFRQKQVMERARGNLWKPQVLKASSTMGLRKGESTCIGTFSKGCTPTSPQSLLIPALGNSAESEPWDLTHNEPAHKWSTCKERSPGPGRTQLWDATRGPPRQPRRGRTFREKGSGACGISVVKHTGNIAWELSLQVCTKKFFYISWPG